MGNRDSAQVITMKRKERQEQAVPRQLKIPREHQLRELVHEGLFRYPGTEADGNILKATMLLMKWKMKVMLL